MSRRISVKKQIQIEKLEFDKKNFLDRSTILLGTSGTGKSKIIMDILHLIKDDVPMCYIFCPTNDVTDAFTGVVPNSCISLTLDVIYLQQIIKMQEERMKIYKLCNDKETLSEIAYKLDDSVITKIHIINDKYIKCKKKLEEIGDIEKMDKLDELYDKQLIKHLKTHIKLNYNDSTKKLLTEHENNIVKLLDINIKVVIVLDDCASKAKDWGKSEVIKEIFFQGRHYQITTIISLQGDKEITPVIRQNAFVVFFTTMQCMKGFFNSSANSFSKDQQKEAEEKGKEIFKKEKGKDTFKKACYIRLNDLICYHKATLRSKFVFNKTLFDNFENDIKNTNNIKLTDEFMKKL